MSGRDAGTSWPFLANLSADMPLLSDDVNEDWVTHGDVLKLAQIWQSILTGPKSLVFVYIGNQVSNVAALLGSLAAGHAVALLDPKLAPVLRNDLERLYEPEFVINFQYMDKIPRNKSGKLSAVVVDYE